MAHLESPALEFGFALQHDLLARPKLFEQKRLIKPNAAQVMFALLDHHVANVRPRLSRMLINIGDHADNIGQLFVGQFADVVQHREVLIRARKKEQYVGGVAQIQLLQQFSSYGTDTFEELDRLREQFGRRFFRCVRHAGILPVENGLKNRATLRPTFAWRSC